MLDKMFWNVFEKTGSIDAYMLYKDMKYVRENKDKKEFKTQKIEQQQT